MRASLYLRVSTDLQTEEGYSLDAQLSRLRAFCDAQDWSVSEIYIDEGISAKDTNRPRLQALLRDAEAHLFDVVLVYKLDRLTRSVLDLHALLQVFDRLGVGFRSATEVFDTTSAIGRLFITIVGALAQWERENLSERVRFGMQELTRQGRWSGGKPAFGYRLEDGQLRPHEPEASVVREIFRRYNAGQGTTAILQWLNDRLDPQPAPYARWTQNALKYLLRNPLYAGYVRFGYRDIGGRRQKDPLISQGNHEAIIDRQTWEAAEGAHASRATFPGRTGTGSFALTGILRCGLCGSAMNGNTQYRTRKSDGPARRYYVCVERIHSGLCRLPKIREEVVENALLDELERRYVAIQDKSPIQVPEHQETRSEGKIEALNRQLSRIPLRRSRWMEAYEAGDISSADLRERLALLDAERDDLEAAITSIEPVGTPNAHVARDLLEHFRTTWEVADLEEKKALIRALVSRIEVHPGPEISVTFAV